MAIHDPYWQKLDAECAAADVVLAEQLRWVEHDTDGLVRMTPVDLNTSPYNDFEHQIGHLVAVEEITLESALEALGAYSGWVALGEPKLTSGAVYDLISEVQ